MISVHVEVVKSINFVVEDNIWIIENIGLGCQKLYFLNGLCHPNLNYINIKEGAIIYEKEY